MKERAETEQWGVEFAPRTLRYRVTINAIGDDIAEAWTRARADQIAHEHNTHAALVEAAEAFLRSACRPGDDGKYDDLYDETKSALLAALAAAKGGQP